MADQLLQHRVAEPKRHPRTYADAGDPLTQARVKELLYYDEGSGLFYHRMRRGCKKPGSCAGTVGGKTNRYSVINIDGRNYPAHRLVWLYVHGKWPNGNIDHVNGDGFDNRLANLRDCDQSNNVFNRRRGHITASGIRGVRFTANAWEATITKDRRVLHLGRFDTFAEAVAARRAGEKCLFEPIPEPDLRQTWIAPAPPGTFAEDKPSPKLPLTAERLRKAVSYDPETGKFRRLTRRGRSSKFAGREPYMAVLKDGHLRFTVHSIAYLAHRLAWLFVYGEWPKGQIHHRNRIPSDNRIANLLDVGTAEHAALHGRRARQ